jgi:pyruvate formate lyase activating enzyme
MVSGMVSDIREFTVHDGPGIRTTVFLKGCPLRCAWCHNPENISFQPQRMSTAVGERTVGRLYTDERLAAILNAQAEILRWNDGGVTFSGGEPLFQARFLEAVLDRLDNMHVVLDTSGFAGERVFARVARRCDLLYFDVKLVDPDLHRQYTGVDNRGILRNLRLTADLGIPVVIRVPLVPGITDTVENLRAIAATARALATLLRVDLLPYNRAAGGKYGPLSMAFEPPFDEAQPVNANTGVFREAGIAVTVGGSGAEATPALSAAAAGDPSSTVPPRHG